MYLKIAMYVVRKKKEKMEGKKDLGFEDKEKEEAVVEDK
jgi:hypothetical protein